MEFEFTQEFAQKLDDQDSLSSFRELFHYPDLHESQTLYFAGNSLGLQPRSTREYLGIELDSWKELAVEGHFHGKNPWFHYHKFSKDSLAKLTGARPTEVVALNNLTSNLHFLMVSFYRPTADRFRIITESDAFPSDQYALESQVRSHGFDPDEAIIEVAPESGNYTLETSKIVDAIKEYGQSTALVLFSGVQYYTGQFFDIAAITEAGQESGAYVGFDLAHAIGNVPLNLHEDGPDFATWCSYKYLNSGPGAVSGIFVHDRHARKPGLPRFAGWWGHDEESRFRMEKGFVPMEGADGWQVSNVNILSSAALRASLDIYDKAGINDLREKSILLTGYLEFMLNELNNGSFEIITPSAASQRGCQLSLLFNEKGEEIFEQLNREGVVADWRDPNVIRVSPAPLYNTFTEVYKFARILGNIIKS